MHCTAGKDRAGFAAAVVLRTLGVPEETVYEDFLLTNHYTADRIERTLWIIRAGVAVPHRSRSRCGRCSASSAPTWRPPSTRSRSSYGAFDAYRREALGLDDAETAAFRQLALE